MKLKIRRTYTFVENRMLEAGKAADIPLRKVAAVLVVENPYAGRYAKNLNPLIAASAALGRELVAMAVAAVVTDGVPRFVGRSRNTPAPMRNVRVSECRIPQDYTGSAH
jgi:hypothetical protein